MGQQYQLTVNNQTGAPSTAMIFQKQPDGLPDNVKALAWFTYPMNDGVSYSFDWQVDYSFVWGTQGTLNGGQVVFHGSQKASASLGQQITLDVNDHGPSFVLPVAPNPDNPASLLVNQTNNVTINQNILTGVGMSGSGTFVVTGQAGRKALFTPHPVYYVAFGDFYNQQVISYEQISNIQEIDFPAGIFEMTATLDTSGIWKVTQGTNTGNLVRAY